MMEREGEGSGSAAGPGASAPGASALESGLPGESPRERGSRFPADEDPAAGGETLSGDAARARARDALAQRPGLAEMVRLWELSHTGIAPSSTSFFYSGALDAGGRPRDPGWLGQWSVWGQGAATRFSGSEDRLTIDGDVTTATLGFDSRGERLLAGVALAYSKGRGTYAEPHTLGGSVASALTSLHPFAEYRFNDRVSVWGILGHGAGSFTLTPKEAQSGIETDLSTTMAALGGRGVLGARSAGEAEYRLVLRSDARFTRTDSAALANLGGATGATSRVRLVLEGSGSLPLGGGVLSPTLEAGLRHDGGDAETGAGVELGGGLAYTSGRFSVQAGARGLLVHRDAEYEEWGMSATARLGPREDGRGLSVDLGSTWGTAQSGVESLWGAEDPTDMARSGEFEAGQQFRARLGYGFNGYRGRVRWQPYVEADAGENGSRALGLGVKMASGKRIEAELRFRTSASERHTIGMQGALRW